jgi:hypothetical protein
MHSRTAPPQHARWLGRQIEESMLVAIAFENGAVVANWRG